MELGNFVIVNECDRPCAMLVAMVTCFYSDGETMRVQYIHEKLGGKAFRTPIKDATTLNEFGVAFAQGRNMQEFWIKYSLGTQARAQYPDGRPRPWQDDLNVRHLLFFRPGGE